MSARSAAAWLLRLIGASLLIATASGALRADTGYCPAPYCGTGRPDPWPWDVPLPNEQLLAAYIARYNCPIGVQPCRPGYSAELFGANWDALENACRAGQLDAFAAPAKSSSVAANFNAALASLPTPYYDGLRALNWEAAGGALSESDYAARRVALQDLVPKSKAAGHNCLATTTEATDSSFAHHRGGAFMGAWWWAFLDGGSPERAVVVHDTTRACGPYSISATSGYRQYYRNEPPCGIPAPRCGDGHLDPGETCSTCPADAGACPPPPPPPDNALHLGPAGRFKVEATWRTADGRSGPAKPRPLEADTGALWFFAPTNLELLVKVLNGCPLGGHWWVFAGGLTDVGVTLTVTDTTNGAVRTYTNPQGTAFAPVQDTGAFACP